MPDVPVEMLVSKESMANARVRHDRVSLSSCVAAIAAADVLGPIFFALVIFYAYAAPRGYSPAELWQGIPEFLVAWVIAAWSQELYSKDTLLADARIHALRGAASSTLAFGIVLLLGFALQLIGSVSRIWLLTWASTAVIWAFSLRLLWSRYLHLLAGKGCVLERALVLAGSAQMARMVGEEVQRESGGKIGVVSAAGIPSTHEGPSLDWIENAVRDETVDRVFIAEFDDAVAPFQTMIEKLERLAVDVTLIPDLGGLRARVLNATLIGSLPALDLACRPLSVVGAVVKRAEDLVLGSIILLAAAPAFVLAAIAIKLDSRGPVLFGQKRQGFHDRTFKLWKFRTMFHEASDPGAKRQTSRCDDRVTRVGRFLRRFSIDELPQVLNVLRGEMSIVGPRPHALGMTSVGVPMTEVVSEYSARHRLRPGITGWAQVNGCRGQIDSHEKLQRRVSLDRYYINNWSVFLDFWIILRTVAVFVFDSDAY
ncbi:MAG: exopolysaccharide biosynthesis polyprenyl glycosylphosphotransferase [Acetobacteraceae bacterium]